MSIGLKANSDGSGAIQVGGSDAITISTGLNTTFAGTAAVPTGTLYPIVSGTAVASTSGTSIDFTSIPSWVKRITVMFSGVSTSGTSNPLFQLGTGGSATTSGYLGAGSSIDSASASSANFTTGFGIFSGAAANVIYGAVIFTNISANIWVASGTFARSNNASTMTTAGNVSLAGALDRVRVTTVNGTDTYDAGTINIFYE